MAIECVRVTLVVEPHPTQVNAAVEALDGYGPDVRQGGPAPRILTTVELAAEYANRQHAEQYHAARDVVEAVLAAAAVDTTRVFMQRAEEVHDTMESRLSAGTSLTRLHDFEGVTQADIEGDADG